MTSILSGARLLPAVVVMGLLLTPIAAGAATFGINGQVFRIDPGEAADPTLEDSDLEVRDPMPYVKIRVIDATSRATLGEDWAKATGNFAVTFEASSGDDVEVQAIRVVDSDGEVLPAAREGINTITLSTAATQMAVKVTSEEAVDLKAGAESEPGIGIIFTEVGKVEIPYICQKICTDSDPLVCPKSCPKEKVGLADMSSAVARADELHLPDSSSSAHWNAVFRDAPFGRGLLIFGQFGQPKGTPGCLATTDWYKVKYRPLTYNAGTDSWEGDPTAWVYWSQTMHKTRYEINLSPFSADSFLELVGPITGSTDKLYRVRPVPTSSTQTVVYSFANLRMNWRTDKLGLDGLYEIAMEYYTQTGGTDDNPVVTQILSTCVDSTASVLPPGQANKVALNQLRLRLNNTAPRASFDGIFIRSAANQYLQQPRDACSDPAPTRTATKSLAADFEDAAFRCKIMELDSSLSDVVEIDFKARHDDGYLRSYSLAATSNASPADVVPFASDNYDNHAASGILWQGLCSTDPQMPCATPAGSVTRTNAAAFPQPCAYIFDLVVRTRIQDGYGYEYGRHLRRAYYVRP
jgi:hypothetical protein